MNRSDLPVQHQATVLPGTACQAQPGDEVLYLDDDGRRAAVSAQIVLITPDRQTVTLVSGSEQELVLPRDEPVLLIRDAGPLWSMLDGRRGGERGRDRERGGGGHRDGEPA
jgi:hypothetical protein